MSLIKSQFELNPILKAIDSFEKKLQSGDDADHIVIFWGFSGTGKSTTIIILNGQQMIGYHNQETCEVVVVNKYPSQKEGDVKIQTDPRGGTWIPAALQLRHPTKQIEKIKLWDLPGFGDNRGITQILINTYFIHRIFALHEYVKLAFTISFTELTFHQKGGQMIQTVKELTNAFDSFPDYQKCMILIITKANHLIDKKGVVISFQKAINQLPAINQNPKILTFFQFVVDEKIPIIIVREAQLTKQKMVTKQNAVKVDYTATIQQFYTIVNQKLTTASFPHLIGPAMNKQLKQKCQGFANQTKNIYQKQSQIFVDNLALFIHKFVPEQLKLSDKIEEVILIFKQIGRYRDFIKELLATIAESQKDSLEILINKFNKLIKLMEQYNYLCQLDPLTKNRVCLTLIKINNQFIIVDFLSTIQFKKVGPQFYWVDKAFCIKQFFKNIQNKQNQIYIAIQRKNNQLIDIIKKTARQKFSKFLVKLRQSQSFKHWQKEMKKIPFFLLHTSHFNQSQTCFEFFQQLKYYQQIIDLNIPQIRYIQKILNVYEHFNDNQPIQFQTLIESNLLPLYKQTVTQILQDQLNIYKYDQDEVTQFLKEFKNKQKSKDDQKVQQNLNVNDRLAERLIQLEQLDRQQKKEINKLKMQNPKQIKLKNDFINLTRQCNELKNKLSIQQQKNSKLKNQLNTNSSTKANSKQRNKQCDCCQIA